jgi:hypothetical protein
MALVPDAWTALPEDDRTQILVAPFVGFIGVEVPSHSSWPRTSISVSMTMPPSSRAPS